MKGLPAEAASFFQSEKGFTRLMDGCIHNYRRLGRIGGTVKLSKLTKKEEEALSGIMGKDYSRQNSATISMSDFQTALEKTKFAGLDLKDLLQAYLGNKLLTRSQEEEIFQQEKGLFFAELKQNYSGELQQIILDYIINKEIGTRGIHQAYDICPSLLKKRLKHVLSAVQSLPKTYVKLPVFANRITKDPHGFDINIETGRLFILALQIIRMNKDETYRMISSPSAEQITEILGEFKIIRDDLLNFVTCTALLGLKGDGHVNAIWKAALQEKAVINVPLRELLKIESFVPANYILTNQGVSEQQGIVFIVENSSVFSEILDNFKDEKTPPLICTHGQFKLAALLLIDKLVKKETVLYYSGDFDPEGLQMAERLINRHPQFIKLWRYTEEDYEHSISHVNLSQTRLNKLRGISTPSLRAVTKKMLSFKKAGYQEQLVSFLIKDMKNILYQQEIGM